MDKKQKKDMNMLLLNIIILTAAIFLIFYADLNFWIGISLFLLSVYHIVFYIIKLFNNNLQINRLRQKLKLKWIGTFNLLQGFDLVPNQMICFGLTTKNTLFFLSEQKQVTIPLAEIEGFLLLSGKQIVNLTNADLKKLLNRQTKTNDFNNLRSTIQENLFLKSKLFLLISLYEKNDANQNIRYTQNLIVLQAHVRRESLRAFLKRTEIRSVARIYHTSTTIN